MDHSLSHNAPLHWGYPVSGTPSNNPSPSSWASTTTRSSKRPLSESEDCDAFSEGSSKDQCTSPADADSCQMLSRKKRRGVIEKKRRDRINTSLSELKRLVPSAFEKQGSAKLEKAEILQMTVDHLKMLHAKDTRLWSNINHKLYPVRIVGAIKIVSRSGLDALAYDPHKYAMDYHGMGFRECVAEVIRYLERIEGLDVQNPLRLRLTSHLQCCAAQRELASKQAAAAATSPWTYGTTQYPPLNPLPPTATATNPSNITSHHQPTSSLHSQTMHELSHFDLPTSCSQTTVSSMLEPPSRLTHSTTVLTPLTTPSTSSLPYSPHQYPPNSFAVPPTTSHHQNYNQSNPNTQGMKPYRPWGAEVAY